MRIVIAGAGDVGIHLARLLAQEKQDTVIIDQDSESLQYVENHLDVFTLKGDATCPLILKEAKIEKAALFIAVTATEAHNITSCILAKKMGSKAVDAIDYDPLCFESTLENTALNNMTDIQAILGGKEVIPNTRYNVILANINRNILLDQLDRYAQVLASEGSLILSGFYEQPDLEIIKEAAHALGLRYERHLVKQEWTAAKFIK